ncbi:MAG: DUF1697 domain-containing protein [Longimicrobiales bacterium]
MKKHVAFLRGINLGKRRLKKDEIKAAFTSFGLTGADTFLASGNVIFDGESDPPTEPALEDHLESAFGFRTDTHLRPMSGLQVILGLDWIPSATDDGFKIHAIFLREPLGEQAKEQLQALGGTDDEFRILGREVFWLRRGGLLDSPFTVRELEKAIGVSHTARNLNTVRRLVAKFGKE